MTTNTLQKSLHLKSWKLIGKLLLLIRVQLSTKVDRLWWKIGKSQTQINSNNVGLKKTRFCRSQVAKMCTWLLPKSFDFGRCSLSQQNMVDLAITFWRVKIYHIWFCIWRSTKVKRLWWKSGSHFCNPRSTISMFLNCYVFGFIAISLESPTLKVPTSTKRWKDSAR